jgi:ATP-dependent phosphoenolpyruvate carboxykinase
MTDAFNLQEYDITVGEIHHNLPPSRLYEHAIRFEKDASIAENGALVAYSGVKTGRSPKDKRVVKHPDRSQDGALPKGQARRQASELGSRRVVGPGEHSPRRPLLRDQPRARP